MMQKKTLDRVVGIRCMELRIRFFFFFFFLTQGFELRLEILGSRKMGSHFDT